MPKKLYHISQFHDGINDVFNLSDIKDSEANAILDLDISKVGKLRMGGGVSSSGAPSINGSALINEGVGLFSYSSDRTYSGAETGENWVVLSDKALSQVDVYDGTWRVNVIDLGSGTDASIVYYVVDGVLRACDAGFDAGNNAYWYGYIDKDRFANFYSTDISYTDTGWYAKKNQFSAPSLEAVNEEIVAYSYTIPAANGGMVINVTETGTGSWDGDYEFAISAVYNDNEESPLATTGTYKESDSGIANDYLSFSTSNLKLVLSIKATLTTHIDERITKYKIYSREVGNQDWTLQAIYNLARGSMANGESDYNQWQTLTEYYGGGASSLPCAGVTLTAPISSDTYLSETGYPSAGIAKEDLYAEYKTSVLAGRRMYIGNVKAYNEDNEFIEMNDAMYRSPTNKFDIFHRDNKVDVAINDGESITALAVYDDKLLQFKDRTLYVINIGQDIEFLEGTYSFRGVRAQNCVATTEYGIAFVNEYGLFLFDGSTVRDLTDAGVGQRIDMGSFYYDPDYTDWSGSFIGYYQDDKQLLVFNDNTTDAVAQAYVYDFRTNSFSYIGTTFPENPLTNLTQTQDGYLLLGYQDSTKVSFKTWSSSPVASSSIKWDSKYIDFGAPSLRKKIYKVYVSHWGAGASKVKLYYRLNGTESAPDWVDAGEFDNNTEYGVPQEFALSGVNNAYSIQLRIKAIGEVSSTFQVNDISIVYRSKNVK